MTINKTIWAIAYDESIRALSINELEEIYSFGPSRDELLIAAQTKQEARETAELILHDQVSQVTEKMLGDTLYYEKRTRSDQ